jgi:hypothetical protein
MKWIVWCLQGQLKPSLLCGASSPSQSAHSRCAFALWVGYCSSVFPANYMFSQIYLNFLIFFTTCIPVYLTPYRAFGRFLIHVFWLTACTWVLSWCSSPSKDEVKGRLVGVVLGWRWKPPPKPALMYVGLWGWQSSDLQRLNAINTPPFLHTGERKDNCRVFFSSIFVWESILLAVITERKGNGVSTKGRISCTQPN